MSKQPDLITTPKISLDAVLAGETRAMMAEIHKNTGRAHIVGLTGLPGRGKSTMVN